MKNVFLTLVFVLGTATSFAGSDSYETKLETVPFSDCIEVTLSCGPNFMLCGDTSDETILFFDELWCGPFSYE